MWTLFSICVDITIMIILFPMTINNDSQCFASVPSWSGKCKFRHLLLQCRWWKGQNFPPLFQQHTDWTESLSVGKKEECRENFKVYILKRKTLFVKLKYSHSARHLIGSRIIGSAKNCNQILFVFIISKPLSITQITSLLLSL